MAPKSVPPTGDDLDHAVAFLKTRDGLDKALKLMRYAAMIGAGSLLRADPRSVTGAKLRGLDASTAVARKYLRLGKFLGNARDLRALLRSHQALTGRTNAVAALVARIESDSPAGRLALRANRLAIACQAAQLAYYFVEQFAWAKSVGLVRSPRVAAAVSRISVYAELLIYVSSLQITWDALRDASARAEDAERALADHLARYKKTDEVDVDAEEEEEEEEEEEDRRVAGVFRSGSTSLRSSFTGSPMKKAGMFLRALSRFENPAAKEETLLEAAAAARSRARLARAAFAAEVADAAVCVGEVFGGEKNPLRAPAVVGTLGMVSAAGGVYEKWVACAF